MAHCSLHLGPPPGSTDGVSADQAKLRADTEAELANLKAELCRRRRSERQLNAWISHLERRLHESEELLQQKASLPGNDSFKAYWEKEQRRRMKEELGKTRSEGLRAAASAALADFEFQNASPGAVSLHSGGEMR